MIRINIVVYFIFFSASVMLFAQQNIIDSEEAFLKQLESTANSLSLQENPDSRNNAQIQQVGNNNNATINQTLNGIKVPGNVAELIQNGDINIALLTQTGYGNNLILNQTGNGNEFEAIVTGNNNSSLIDQIGNDNYINQNLIGNDMALILSQFGNNNEIVQVENDLQSRQYQIIQNGNAMKLIIINGGSLP